MNKSSSVLINRRANRTIFANIVEQKQAVAEGKQLRVTYITDNTSSVLVSTEAGATETTVVEYQRYIDAPEQAQGPSLPDPPTSFTATSASGEVILTFTPGSDGGAAITNYMYSLNGGTSYSAFSPATGPITGLTISGLTNGRTYSIKLKAVNAIGESTIGSETVYITPLPGSALRLFLDGAFVDPSGVTWPDTSGKGKNATLVGGPVRSTDNSGAYVFDGVNDHATVPSGFADVSAGITVLAFANFGASKDTWERIIDFGTGEQRNNILFARAGTSSNLTFQIYNGINQPISLSKDLSGGIIENGWGFYVARLDGARYLLKNQNIDVSGDDATLPVAVNRTSNYIAKSNWADDAFEGRVGILAVYGSALTDAEIDQFFDLYKARYFSKPAAPTNLVATPGDGQVSIAFTAGATGGSPITNYEYSTDGISYSAFSPAVLASPVAIGGLSNGTSYTIRLRALNVMGSGTEASVTATPITVPAAPTNLVATPGDGQVSIAFTAGATGGSPITNYKYSINAGSYSAFSPADTSSPVVITGLTNGATYEIKLRAVNAAGDGLESSAVSVTPVSPVPSGNVYTSPTTIPEDSISNISPFSGGGYSYQFDGTSDYLTVQTDDSWDFGTGDFTIEWFQYQTDSNRAPRIFSIGKYGPPNTINIACSIESGIFYTWFPSAVSFGNLDPNSTTPYKNVWVHFAIVRQSSVLRVYRNGFKIGSNQSNNTNISNSTPLYIGSEADLSSVGMYGGYLTNIRIVKGLAVYSGDFTNVSNFNVPTSELTLTASANPYGGSNTAAIPAGFTKLLLVPVGDAIAASLTTSLSAYNSASTDDWIKITSAEYSALQTNITGTTKVGLADSYLIGTSGTNASGLSQTSSALVSNTVTTLNVAIPANNYVYAFALRYVTTTPSEGMRVYTNTSISSTGGYNQVGNVLPSISTSGISYFVRKGVTSTNGATAGLLGFFTGTKMNYSGSFYGSAGYIGFNNYSSPTPPTMRYLLNSNGAVPDADSDLTGGIPSYGAFQIQGLTTATKQWN